MYLKSSFVELFSDKNKSAHVLVCQEQGIRIESELTVNLIQCVSGLTSSDTVSLRPFDFSISNMWIE